jgi:hypothetical protein
MTSLVPRRRRRSGRIRSMGRLATVISLCAWPLVACQPETAKRSRVNTVRVLAVQKSMPYAPPGARVDFDMLWFDGREPPAPSEDPVEPMWVAGCTNPPADLYYWCFLQVALAGAWMERTGFVPGEGLSVSGPSDPDRPDAAPEVIDLVQTGTGSRFSYTVPADIIARHPEPTDGQQPYGVSYVFFTACAGELHLLPEWRALGEQVLGLVDQRAGARSNGSSGSAGDAAADTDLRAELLTLIGPSGLPNSFPLGCRASSGELVGPDEYVAGYGALYAYEELENANPKIRGLELGDETFQRSTDDAAPASRLCFGPECVTAERPDEALPDTDDCGDYALCVPKCDRADRSQCPSYAVRPVLDPKDVEKTQSGGKTEQMWVRYYASAGSLERDTGLVNDALSGFHSDFGAGLRAPREAGPLFVWAAVHDSRGGVDWVRAAVLATER